MGTLPLEFAALDVPLFALASLLAAGVRFAVWTVLVWTLLVTAGMVVYATATRQAAWGMLLMASASAGTLVASSTLLLGRVPTEWVVRGPFAFRTTPDATGHLAAILRQIAVFWTAFLVVIPSIAVLLERRWRLDVAFPLWLRFGGLALFALASGLGVWSALTMAKLGEGTPLPSRMAKRLVVAGPYRWVRNPMAIAGIAQGAAVGLIVGSWLVVVYALLGSAIWNGAVRPHEEADLQNRFGAEFEAYRARIGCWWPSFRGF